MVNLQVNMSKLSPPTSSRRDSLVEQVLELLDARCASCHSMISVKARTLTSSLVSPFYLPLKYWLTGVLSFPLVLQYSYYQSSCDVYVSAFIGLITSCSISVVFMNITKWLADFALSLINLNKYKINVKFIQNITWFISRNSQTKGTAWFDGWGAQFLSEQPGSVFVESL